jgi:hypothetical protein
MDACQFYLIRHTRAHGPWTEERLANVPEEQLRLRPNPAVNSVAWLYWHVARVEDLAINRFVADRSQVLDDEEWMPRLGVYRRDLGQGMTFDEVDELSARVDLAALRSYWDAVGRRTADVVAALTPDDLDQTIDAGHVRRVIFDEGAIQSDQKEELHGLWIGMSRGYTLNYLGLTHTFYHFGEIDVIRGLWGHRGHF